MRFLSSLQHTPWAPPVAICKVQCWTFAFQRHTAFLRNSHLCTFDSIDSKQSPLTEDFAQNQVSVPVALSLGWSVLNTKGVWQLSNNKLGGQRWVVFPTRRYEATLLFVSAYTKINLLHFLMQSQPFSGLAKVDRIGNWPVWAEPWHNRHFFLVGSLCTNSQRLFYDSWPLQPGRRPLWAQQWPQSQVIPSACLPTRPVLMKFTSE